MPRDSDIPAVSLSRLGEMALGRPRVPLSDVLRHEMAHALAYVHLDVVDTPSFARVPGASYWSGTASECDPDLHVSTYAATSPCEDFSETVMCFTRHRGRTSKYAHRSGVMEGFAFVRALSSRLRRHGVAMR